MGHHSRRKDQPRFLRSGIDRPQQTTSGNTGTAGIGINHYAPHPRQVNHETSIAGAKASQTVSSTANGSKDSSIGCGSDRTLNIAQVDAARDETRFPRDHAIPNRTRLFEAAVAGPQKIALELTPKRGVDFPACPNLFITLLRSFALVHHESFSAYSASLV